MAIMHPSTIIDRAHVASEVKFYKALKEQLSDKFHVFYSVRWYSTDAQGMRTDSECDFLIFNPDYGFICIEVKGGTSIKVEDGIWYLDDDTGGRELKKSPYRQAEQSMYFFKKYYEDELETQYPGVYGNAVAFPNFAVNNPLTVDSPLELTIDSNDMNRLSKRIIELFRYFKGNKAGGTSYLSKDAQEKFISLINKRIALAISAGALIEEKERELSEINKSQDVIIDLLTHYKRAFFVGGAGTGKTWIAIKKVQKSILDGKKALYLCYNKALANYVAKLFNGQADCYNFETLCFQILKDKAIKAPMVNGVKEYANLWVSDGITLPQYDLIVVDEGQDFSEDWALCVNLLVKEGGSLYVMYDENQNIFNRKFGDKFSIDQPPLILKYNIRNTANIYDYATDRTSLGKDTIANQIEGVKPEIRSFTRKSQVITYLDSVINKLINKEGIGTDKIVILSNRVKGKSILKDTMTLSGISLDEDNESGTLKYRTIQGFKGLESDIIVYINHTYKNESQTDAKRALLYTAITRAKFYLYCIDFEEAIN